MFTETYYLHADMLKIDPKYTYINLNNNVLNNCDMFRNRINL